MRRLHWPATLVLATLVAFCLQPVASWAAEAEFAATAILPTKGLYLGAYIHQDPVVKGDVAAFERLVGKKHAVYLRYVGYGEPFPYQWAQSLRAVGAIPQIAWEPNNGLSEVQDDAYLRGWAEAARHFGAPILLRYASEMNGAWMPYSGDPDEYIRKWRLVYRVMHQTAPNVVMIWCPFGVPRSTIPLYYPGDEFVDWVGVNIYAVVYNNGDPRQPATDTQFDQLKFVYNLYADRKPIAICEYAATHFCRAAKRSTTDFAVRSMKEFYELLPKQFPRVVLLSWFSVDASADGLADNDYAVTTDPAVLAAYRELIGKDVFLSEVVGLGAGPGPGAGVTPPDVIKPPAPAPALPVVPSRPLPLTGPAAPGPEELVVAIRGASPQAATGTVTITAAVGEKLPMDNVTFLLDGKVRCITNIQPCTWNWNTAAYEPGEHIIRVVVTAPDGEEVAQKEVSVIVADQQPNAD